MTTKRGQHPNSRANLIPFKAGQSGNPKGTPGPKITPLIRKYLEMPVEDFLRLDQAKLTTAELTAYGIVWEACQHGPQFVRGRDIVLERIDGKPIAIAETEKDEGSGPIRTVYVSVPRPARSGGAVS